MPRILRSVLCPPLLIATVLVSACGSQEELQESVQASADPAREESTESVSFALEVAGSEEQKAANKLIHLDQGWTQAERDSFYYDSVGSRWLPYAWFLALEQPTGEDPFRSPSNMARYGAYFGDPSPKNPDRLPIGFARVDVTGEAWVGPNCASCHVSEFTYRGKKIHIDGGAGLAEQYKLVKDFTAALTATAVDAKKLKRFAVKVLRAGRPSDAQLSTLRARILEVAQVLRKNYEGSGSASGPGRNDSFKFILSNTNCVVMGLPENCIGGDGKPLRFAPIWGAQALEWDHHNSSAHNPLLRNFIAMSGYPFGSFDGTNFDLNIDLSALRAATALLEKLKEPEWPEYIFGPIDLAKAMRGENVYVAKCASCHTLPPHPLTEPNVYGKQAIKSVIVPIDLTGATPASATSIGTDPGTVSYYFYEKQNPGPLAPYIPPALIDPDGKALASVVYNTLIGTAFQQQLAKMNLAPEQVPEFLFFREIKAAPPEQLMTIRARLPEGISWKGNYLHNGAVRNLYELLLPEGQRTQQFVIGDHEFDSDNLGFKNRAGQPQQFSFDTSKLGNSNRGHSGPAYGTDMSDADRRAVLEFLKTL